MEYCREKIGHKHPIHYHLITKDRMHVPADLCANYGQRMPFSGTIPPRTLSDLVGVSMFGQAGGPWACAPSRKKKVARPYNPTFFSYIYLHYICLRRQYPNTHIHNSTQSVCLVNLYLHSAVTSSPEV